MRSMSALRLLFGFRKEVPSHVIVDIRLLVLLLLKGFAAAAVFLFLCLSLEGEKRSRSFDQNVRPTERDSSKRKKKSRTGTRGKRWGSDWTIVRRIIIETRESMTSPSLLIDQPRHHCKRCSPSAKVYVNCVWIVFRTRVKRPSNNDSLIDTVTQGEYHQRPEQNTRIKNNEILLPLNFDISRFNVIGSFVTRGLREGDFKSINTMESHRALIIL